MSEPNPSQRPGPAAWRKVSVWVATLCVGAGLLADVIRGDPFSIGARQAALIVLGLAIYGLGKLSRIWIMRATLLSTAVVIGLVLCELVVRVFFSAHYSTIYALHSEYLMTLIPNARRIFSHHASNGGDRLLLEVDERGHLKGPSSPGKGRRVLVYGDSFVAAEFSRPPDRFTSQLEGMLSRRLSERVDVINAGVIGYGPDQIVTRMESEAPALEPDLVVVAVYSGNDYGDLIRNKMFELGATGNLRRRSFEIAGAVRRRFRESGDTALYLPRVVRKGMSGVSWRRLTGAEDAFSWDLVELNDRASREYADYLESNVVRNLLVDRYDADVAIAPEAPSSRYKRMLMDALLERLGQLAEDMALPLLVVVIPSPFDVCEDYEGTRSSTNAYPAYRRRALVDPIVASLRGHAIEHVDLFDPFREHQAEGLYFRLPDQHWNEAGQRLAAELVVERIASEQTWRPHAASPTPR